MLRKVRFALEKRAVLGEIIIIYVLEKVSICTESDGMTRYMNVVKSEDDEIDRHSMLSDHVQTGERTNMYKVVSFYVCVYV